MEGKIYREIAQIAHASIKDIKPIIMKYERSLKSKIKNDDTAEPVKKISKNSKAYELLLQGKSPVEIAIELNLPYKDLRKYWTEFLQLQKMKELYEIDVDNEYHLDYLFTIYYFLLRNQVDKKKYNKCSSGWIRYC